MKKTNLFLLIAAAGVVVALMLWFKREPPEEPTEEETARAVLADVGKKKMVGPRRKSVVRADEKPCLAADIERALEREDFDLAAKCASRAMDDKDVETRQAMVDTLGWFGARAIPELTPFLADADDGVAESARNAWQAALLEIEDEGERISLVEAAMKILSDEAALDSVSNEYVGVDTKLAIDSLLRIIEGAGSDKGIEKAKETYAFVTGDTFVDRTTAVRWLSENYAPPEAP